MCALVGETCCTYIPGDNSSIDVFAVAMNKLKELWEEVHSNAGQTPDLDMNVLSVGSLFGYVQDFLDWPRTGFGFPRATIISWILKVVLYCL